MKKIVSTPLIAKAKLHEQHGEFKKLLESSPDVICSFDEQGQFLYTSVAAKKVWGYEPEELVGRKYMDLVYLEDHGKTIAAAQAIIAGANVTHFENRYFKKDGSLIPVVWSATWDEQEKIMYCVAKDASEKKQLEEKLNRTRLMFESFMNHSPLAGCIIDDKGVMQYMNDQYLKVYSFSKHDIGKSIFTFFPIQDASDYHKNSLRVLREGKAHETVEKAVLPDGKEQVLKIFKFPIQFNGDAMIASWTVDITQQMELQQALERSVERYHYVGEATSDAIFEWDLKANTVYRGQGFERIFGKVIDNNPIERNIHPEDRALVKKIVQCSLKDPAIDRYQLEYRYKVKKDTYKQLIARAFILRNAGEAVRVIGAVEDVTEQRELQDSLNNERIKEQIIKSIVEVQEKEKQNLALELHDNVNQMLASCKLMLEFVLGNDPTVPDLLKTCYDTLQQVMSEIRKISHDLNPSLLEDIELHEAIKLLIGKINATGKLNIQFRNKVDRAFPFKQEEKITLYRIIQEQVSNIVKHADASKVIIALYSKSRTVSLLIEDDGKGFDVEKAKKGSGFKNIRNRIYQYDGTFELNAKPGQGCKIEVKLKL